MNGLVKSALLETLNLLQAQLKEVRKHQRRSIAQIEIDIFRLNPSFGKKAEVNKLRTELLEAQRLEKKYPYDAIEFHISHISQAIRHLEIIISASETLIAHIEEKQNKQTKR